MTDRTPDLLSLLDQAGRTPDRPKGMRLGWRNTNPDLRSRDGFRWAFPGEWTYAPDDGRDISRNHPEEACPSDTLGGLCLAKTWSGARSGGITSAVCLVVAYQQRAVLGQDTDKLRVFGALTLDVVDVAALIRTQADLTGADLTWADLTRADLAGADLTGADLTRANLDGVNLAEANLRDADLIRADLTRANLDGANLYCADLRDANLDGADLYGADLSVANLYGAYLAGADLTRANLNGAAVSAETRVALPSGWVIADGRIVREP